jgi:hypothetical protein
MVQFQSRIFISHLVECMNSFNIQIHLYYELMYFLQCKKRCNKNADSGDITASGVGKSNSLKCGLVEMVLWSVHGPSRFGVCYMAPI